MVSLSTLLAAAAVATCAGQIDPQHKASLTSYHLNPATAGAVPINMDSGDARGDLYFYLGEFLLPLECADKDAKMGHFDCNNPERVDPNLVVTKVDMEIDSRMTKYSACNLCNGTDPFTHKPCEVGTYVCDCFGHQSGGTCDATKIGTEPVPGGFKPPAPGSQCKATLEQYCNSSKASSMSCTFCLLTHQKQLKAANCSQSDEFLFCPNQFHKCDSTSPDWECWSQNIGRKTAGTWYSTLAQGQCNKSSPVGSCGWKALSTTTIKNTCLKEKLVTHAETASPSCFQACGARNTTSHCWISCFFDTLLGPGARNSSEKDLGGLPIEELEKVWQDAFLPETDGGCTPVAMSAKTFVV